jgi:mannose-6-phosphate isomerase
MPCHHPATMTALDESCVPGAAAVLAARAQLLEWLLTHALSLWDRHGVDRRMGGFFESLSTGGPDRSLVVAGSVRRGRVVARQTYVFDLGRRLGWRSAFADPADHGCAYLFAHLQAGDGLFHTAVDAQDQQPQASFSLYEQAFCLFALARLDPSSAGRHPIAASAARCLERLRSRYGKRIGGFEESVPHSVPLKSNPHMHLLEAALEWIKAARGAAAQQPWIDLARELVGLCLTRFRDDSSGAVREYFDYSWGFMPGEDGRIVEPGHQFEWAWLLLQWSESPHSTPAERATSIDAARRLVELGERWGVDSGRGVAINEIWDDMTAKDRSAKFWPQTERLKAWCALRGHARNAAEAAHADRQVVAAAQGVAKYLRTDVPGLWFEVCLPDGTLPVQPCKASSFYHVACAIDVLRTTAHATQSRVPDVPHLKMPE